MSQDRPPATFITFYSFKGGVGRSMALINTAGILAGRRGFQILVIDLDLEAPGLSYLNPSAPDVSSRQIELDIPLQRGFVDLLNDAKERGQEADLFTMAPSELANRYTHAIQLPEEFREFRDGSLHIMPAGCFDGNYAERFDSLNLGDLYNKKLGEPLIRAFKKKLGESGLYDYILVDSRTGFSDESGICTRDLADHLMILSGLNRQNEEGTCQFLRALRAATDGKKTFQIILSPVPNGEDALLDQRADGVEKSFEVAWGGKVDVSLQIPYHPQLALTEEPHIFRRRRGHLFQAYCAIESSMLEELGHRPQSFYELILLSLGKKDYEAALRDLRHMIRLDRGKRYLIPLVQQLTLPRRRKAEVEPSQEGIYLDSILRDDRGRGVIEFIVDWIPLEEFNWLTGQFSGMLEESSPDLADRLFRRRIEATPDDTDILEAYSVFLVRRGDIEGAETIFKRAIEVAPYDARHLAHYAALLANYKGEADEAERYYKRAIEANPESASSFISYGKFLADLGRLEEAEVTLLTARKHYDQFNSEELAYLCLALWFVLRMGNRDAVQWERQLKFYIHRGFKRALWNFNRLLIQASISLSDEEFQYATGLVDAVLDERKVSALDNVERWRELEPLDPDTSAETPNS